MILLPHGLKEASLIPDGQGMSKLNPDAPKATARVLLLNLMPEKQATERDIVRMLSAEGMPHLELVPLKISGQTYKNTPQSHMESFYTNFEDVSMEHWDGLIITGAPLEHLAFEEVRYWNQLRWIMAWAEVQVSSTLHLCWAAQAALYHRFGIRKKMFPRKLFGVYKYKVSAHDEPLTDRCGSTLSMPVSRYSEADTDAILMAETEGQLKVVCKSPEAGIGIAVGHRGRDIYVTGHFEYEPGRLDFEYRRDLRKGLDIQVPANYYRDAATQAEPLYSWQRDAQNIYRNWILNYVIAN